MIGTRRLLRAKSVVSLMPGLIALCILAGADAALADKLKGIYPTCSEPGEVEKAEVAFWRNDMVAFGSMNCSQSEDRGKPVRVFRCAVDVTPRNMERFSHPVPSDESLPDGVCEVELVGDDGSSGVYYTRYMNIKKPLSAAIPEAARAHNLLGFWPTCWEPEVVEKADEAANRGDWATVGPMKCGLLGDVGTPVRVIRCAADVTPAQMEEHFDPVPQDDSLPESVCEVEVFDDDGSSGLYYTYFFNIEKSL